MTRPFFHFITLFPETIHVWMTTSILGRAHDAGLFEFKTYQLRDFSTDKHLNVDDVAYGGGGGMVLKVEPLAKAVESIWTKIGRDLSCVVYFSPVGTPMTHELVKGLAYKNPTRHFIFVCGHYEGVDQRFIDLHVDWQISLGDFVLSGGEIPALAWLDAVARLQEGVLHDAQSHAQDSFSVAWDGLLDHPHYKIGRAHV